MKTELAVETTRDATREAVERFLAGRDDALLYYSSRFLRFLVELLGCADRTLVALQDGEIRGLLPLLCHESPRGKVYNSLPFYGSNGGVLAQTEAAAAALCDEYNRLAQSPGTVSSTVIQNPFSPEVPARFVHNLTDSRIAQFTTLPATMSEWPAFLKRLDSSARRNVNKAVEEGIQVTSDPGALAPLRKLHEASMAAIGGTTKPPKFFELLPRHFRPGQDYDLYLATKDGARIGALLLFYFGRTVEYYIPAVDPAFRTFQALPMILMTAMENAARRGFSRWNWGGTWHTQEGVYRFKKKWAAEERPYTYFIQLNDPTYRDMDRSSILSMHPNFYVLPFSALRSAGDPTS